MSTRNRLENRSAVRTWRTTLRPKVTGRRFDPRDNSLNLIRLVLAGTVLIAHCYPLSGLGDSPQLDGWNLGEWAVFGFFAISGYLITASRFSNSLKTYLIHRIARIMPAFWVCLLVTVGFFAPIGYWVMHHTIDGFLTSATAPGNYLLSNAFLKIAFWDVAGTPSGIPYPGAWNGSLWTLYFEFLCYLIVGAVAVFAWVRRSPWALEQYSLLPSRLTPILSLYCPILVATTTSGRWPSCCHCFSGVRYSKLSTIGYL